MASILSVRHLTKRFRLHLLGDKIITGCEDVSFDVAPGSFVLLRGSNGSGKSSVLRCIYRTYLPTEGFLGYIPADGAALDLARADEEDVLDLRRQEIGYVAQFLKVVPRVPARDVVAEPLVAVGWDQVEARRMASDMLARVRIGAELWDASPVTFSGGEQQRINVARALLMRPRLLLLDEPTASQDPANRDVVIAMLRELKEAGTGIVGIFHELTAVEPLVDCVVPLERRSG